MKQKSSQMRFAPWPVVQAALALALSGLLLARPQAAAQGFAAGLKLCGGSKQEGPEAFELSDAWLQDGTPVAPDALTFKLNTLADRRHSGSHYWIDSGSVYLK